MSLPDLAVIADVQAMCGRTFTTAETTQCARLITIASGMVRGYCKQSISQVLADTFTLEGSWDSVITLPERPVTNVASVTVNGVAWAGGKWTWDRFGNLKISTGSFMPDMGASPMAGGVDSLMGPAGSSSNIPSVAVGSWQGQSTQITVVYDHGYAAIPLDITNLVAGAVAAQMGSSPGIQREDIGGYKVFYTKNAAAGGGITFSDDDRKTLNQYRLRNWSGELKKSV